MFYLTSSLLSTQKLDDGEHKGGHHEKHLAFDFKSFAAVNLFVGNFFCQFFEEWQIIIGALKQDLVLEGSCLPCGYNPYGWASFDRAFVLTYATAHTSLEIQIRQLNRHPFTIRSGHDPFN